MFITSMTLIASLISKAAGSYVDVDTTAGTLRGQVVEYPVEYPEGNKSSTTVIKFLGVPYARPPVGDLRWKNPQKVESWEGVRNATAYGNSCWQNIVIPLPTPMSEDCLFLNIWLPGSSIGKLGRSSPRGLTVMFWIHGGGFQIGTGSLEIYNGAYLAHDQNVIVVTINYRLNSFGFLSTELKTDEGNWGLKDCVLALEWIQENIRSFGGEPNTVTIFGESTGSAIVSHLMVSRQAKGLFKRAIGQSGSGFNYWAMNARGTNHKIQQNLASNLDCPANNNGFKCLMNKTPRDILIPQHLTPFAPNIDGTFFHDDPENILLRGDFESVDFINGVNSHEGFFYANIIPKDGYGMDILQFNDTVSNYMNYLNHPDNKDTIQHGINLVYDDYTVGDVVRSLDRIKGLVDFISDFEFIAGSHKFSVLYQKISKKKTFCYFMDAKISKQFQYLPNNYERPDWAHTGHADDIHFVFGGVKYTNKTVTQEERELSAKMMTAWATFAKTGNPRGPGSLDWPEFTGSNYLQLSTPVSSSTVIERFFPKRMDFWINYVWQKLDVPSVKCAPTSTSQNSTEQSDKDYCPVCLKKAPRNITGITCEARHAFKVSILTANILVIESDLRTVTGKVKLDRYITYGLDPSCSCDEITKTAQGEKLLLLTMATKDNMSSQSIDNSVTVFKLHNKLQKKIFKGIQSNKCLK